MCHCDYFMTAHMSHSTSVWLGKLDEHTFTFKFFIIYFVFLLTKDATILPPHLAGAVVPDWLMI